ncbi:helix-hairpin-helix domain-containing protein [Caminicella sporogenes]|uniref:helix-hairpin-helix domain-containing protein n=1 Tax=Caminicella sporogenes TaxID=166485 RepID=UPI00254244A6|nr:helix-hairpin-helix domain-containing protein [Caminicella sporogenes]WIF94441.1 helix-hairpin-helix domain-containing protein [Caminicella sporogenes]
MDKFSKREIFLLTIIFIMTSVIIGFKVKSQEEPIIVEKTEVESIKEKTLDEIETKEIIVDIWGAVKNPGLVVLREGDRINDAVLKAGGLTEKADRKRINLAKRVYDEQKIIIPEKGEEFQKIKAAGNDIGHDILNDYKININTASKLELMSIKGIGEAYAERIIEYRQKNGPFKNIEELKNIKGIGEKRFKAIKEYIKLR